MEVILSISLHPYIYYPPRAVIHTSVRSQLSVLVVVALAEFVQNTLFTSTTHLHYPLSSRGKRRRATAAT